MLETRSKECTVLVLGLVLLPEVGAYEAGTFPLEGGRESSMAVCMYVMER